MSNLNYTTETHAAAQRLASALRSGLDLRWSIPASPLHLPQPFPLEGHVRAFLEPYADALECPMPRSRHPLHRILRLARFVLRKLSSPWLRFQLRFNLSTVSVLEQVEQRVRALEEAERSLRQTLETLETMLSSNADRALEKP